MEGEASGKHAKPKPRGQDLAAMWIKKKAEFASLPAACKTEADGVRNLRDFEG